jgi:N-methylhydantoinase A
MELGIDIGGTFTDVVVFDRERRDYRAHKALSTPADLAEGVLNGIGGAIDSLADVQFCVHGTTVGLNAFIERRGERVLLLATRGTGDVYHIGRGERPRDRMYDSRYRRPSRLVPRRDVYEVGGRLNYAGEEVEPLSLDDLRDVVEYAREESISSIAVAFLFSYVNPAHELEAERALHEQLPGVAVSLSHRVAREWREYERTSSVVLDAYVGPTVREYVQRLEDELRERGMRSRLHVMQSSGGVMSAATAQQRPIRTLLSGPVGGAIGSAALSRLRGDDNLICIDAGGTSFDVSLIMDGRPEVARETSLDGFPLLSPVVNIHTIGAGGGSIAHVEAGGLRVGPRSAGAFPGPACYGRGGTDATVTDAHLVLGRIDPNYFLGGKMVLDVEAAFAALEPVAAELGFDVLRLAEGIVDITNAKMADAIRTLTVERGISPRDFKLVSFGGAGSLHAAFLARELGIREVIVPAAAGTFSAWGMLQADLRHDVSRSFYRRLAEIDDGDLEAAFRELELEGTTRLDGDEIPRERHDHERLVDMRYVGQEYVMTVSADGLDGEGLAALDQRFQDLYLARYGHRNEGAAVEAVAIRVASYGRRSLEHRRDSSATDTSSGDAVGSTREIVFDGAPQPTRVVHRRQLGQLTALPGPAIVEEETTTTAVPPGCRARLDAAGNLVIEFDV